MKVVIQPPERIKEGNLSLVFLSDASRVLRCYGRVRKHEESVVKRGELPDCMEPLTGWAGCSEGACAS